MVNKARERWREKDKGEREGKREIEQLANRRRGKCALSPSAVFGRKKRNGITMREKCIFSFCVLIQIYNSILCNISSY